MLKSLTFSITVAFAFFCLSSCSNSGHSGNSEYPKPIEGSLNVQCLERPGLGKLAVTEKETFAVLTNLAGGTNIHFDEIMLNCAAAAGALEISHTIEGDTLKLSGNYTALGKCPSCNSSFDLTIEFLGKRIYDIRYVLYIYENAGGDPIIFPVRYE